MVADSTVDDPALVAQVRGEIYKLLAVCFYEPKEELANDIVHGSIASALRNLLESIEADGWEESIIAIAECPDGLDVESMYRSLKQEYTRLFIGPGHLLVPPYESVHRQDVPELERGLVMGRSTVDVQRRYAIAGLQLCPDFTDLPDHVAVELEFMCFLCSKEAEAWEEGDNEMALQYLQNQKEFLAEHLLKWFRGFYQAVDEVASLNFYPVMAGITNKYIHLERHRLDNLIERPNRCKGGQK